MIGDVVIPTTAAVAKVGNTMTGTYIHTYTHKLVIQFFFGKLYKNTHAHTHIYTIITFYTCYDIIFIMINLTNVFQICDELQTLSSKTVFFSSRNIF